MTMKLLQGHLVRLTAENPDAASKAMQRWNMDTEYVRLLDSNPPRLYSEKKFKEGYEKGLENGDDDELFFNIHLKDADEIIGFVGLIDLNWNQGDALVAIGIGEREYWGKGYGTDAMQVFLRYAFQELNLHKVSLSVSSYNPRAVRSYEKAGFRHEGRQCGALLRDGQRWDVLYMGILREEWEMNERNIQ